jgi:hypothetical protein
MGIPPSCGEPPKGERIAPGEEAEGAFAPLPHFKGRWSSEEETAQVSSSKTNAGLRAYACKLP